MPNTNLVELVQNLIFEQKPGTDIQRTLRIACPWLYRLTPADRALCVADIQAAAADPLALRAELLAWEGSARAFDRGIMPGVTEWVEMHRTPRPTAAAAAVAD